MCRLNSPLPQSRGLSASSSCESRREVLGHKCATFGSVTSLTNRLQFLARCVPCWAVFARLIRPFNLIVLLAAALLIPRGVWASGQPQPGLSSAVSGATSASVAVNLLAVLPPTLHLSISTLSLDIHLVDPTQHSATITVPVTSSWSLSGSASAVELVGYFDSPQHALVDAGNNAIPSSRVLGAVNGDPMQPFIETASIGTPGASRTLFRELISHRNVRGDRTDNLKVQVDRVDDLGKPAGKYSGTLHLRLISY